MDITLLLVSTQAFLIAAAVSCYSWSRYRLFSYLVLIWFFVALGLAQIPYFQNDQSWTTGDWKGFLPFVSLLSIPVIALLFAWRKSQKFQAFLDQTPTWVFVLTQVYRLAGVTFLVYFFQDKLPWHVGLVSGTLDTVVAIGAIPVAYLVYKYGAKVNSLLVAWNVLGLLDFAISFTIVSLSFIGLISLSPEPTLLGMPPLTLISIFQVPLAIFIHIYLLSKITRN